MSLIVSSGESEELKHAIAFFVSAKQGLPYNCWGEHTSIALLRGAGKNSRIVCGVIYNTFDAADVAMHIGLEPGGLLTPQYIRACFEYPFDQLKKNRVTAMVAKKNRRAVKFVTKLGFKFEGCVRKHFPKDDLMIYGLLREEAYQGGLIGEKAFKSLMAA